MRCLGFGFGLKFIDTLCLHRFLHPITRRWEKVNLRLLDCENVENCQTAVNTFQVSRNKTKILHVHACIELSQFL